MCDANILRLQMYTAAINAVLSKPNKFTDSMACALCGEKHSFKDCKTLLYVDFLRKHFIAYCLQWKSTHRQINTAVNQLEAAPVADDNDQETVLDNSDSDTTADDNKMNRIFVRRESKLLQLSEIQHGNSPSSFINIQSCIS